MKQLNNAQGSIAALRRLLQQQSTDTAHQLARSVGRATSVDLFPCTEYGAEVAQQHRLSEELLFVQHCRAALERAVDKGGARLVWRWQDGGRTEVRFRRENHHIRMTVRQQRTA